MPRKYLKGLRLPAALILSRTMDTNPDHTARDIFLSTIFLFSSVLCPQAAALEITEQVGPVECSVYAPDWTWQKRDINILFVLRNTGTETENVSLDLRPPKDLENHFTYSQVGDTSPYPHARVTVLPGETIRHAFTGITARDGVPRQTYDFSIRLRTDTHKQAVAYPVKTIRGAAVNPGKWALYLPIGIALAWSVAFVYALRKMGGPRAWLIVSEPLETDEGESS